MAQRLLAVTKTVQSELARGRDALDRLRARRAALLRRLLAVAANVEAVAVRAAPENGEERTLREAVTRLRTALCGPGDVLAHVAALVAAQGTHEEAGGGALRTYLAAVQRQLAPQSCGGIEQSSCPSSRRTRATSASRATVSRARVWRRRRRRQRRAAAVAGEGRRVLPRRGRRRPLEHGCPRPSPRSELRSRARATPVT